jgi:serine/threonine protein kinase
MTAHQVLINDETISVLHRDISSNNILINPVHNHIYDPGETKPRMFCEHTNEYYIEQVLKSLDTNAPA